MGKFGQPTVDGGSYVWVDGKYSVITGMTSPIVDITVTGFTDVWDQYAVCEGFLPPDPVFENANGSDYMFGTGLGQVEMIITKSACVLMFV